MSPHVCTKMNKKSVLLWIAAILMVVLGLPNASRSGEPNGPKRSPSARRHPAAHTSVMARNLLVC